MDGGGGGGIMVTLGDGILGSQMIARIPPISVSMNPITNPPSEPAQLSNERMIIPMPKPTCWFGRDLRRLAKMMMRIPQTTPTRPITPPIPAKKNVRAAPTTDITTPERTMIMPPASVRP